MCTRHHSSSCVLLYTNLSSTEPNSYIKPPHHGIMRTSPQIMYDNMYQTQRMMPSTSVSGSYNQGQWASPPIHFSPASSNPGASNGVGMSQVNTVNPVPSLSTTGEGGNSLPLLTSGDLEILDIRVSGNQPRQEQMEHSVQHLEQPFHRKETMPTEEPIWSNYEALPQASGTQNGPASTGMMGINYTYSEFQGGNENLQTLVTPQTGLHLKQEPQGQSSLAMLNPNNSSIFDYHMINYPPTSSSNQEAMRHAASSGASASEQRTTQTQSYSLTSMVQETSHLDNLSWHYNQFGAE